jgi:hypothetical protein
VLARRCFDLWVAADHVSGHLACKKNPAPEEREQIERLLEQVNAALDLLEKVRPGTSD